MYSEKYIKNKMVLSLNCLVLGRTSNNVFTKYIGETSEIEHVTVTFDELTVAGFKKLLLDEEELQGSGIMEIRKVEFDLESLKDNIYTKNNIKDIGDKMEPMYGLKDYFNDNDKKPKSKYLHIFIVPTDPPNKRIKYDDIGMGYIQDKTTEYLQDLLRPFDEAVDCNNINSCLIAPLRKKLPAHPVYCRHFPEFCDNEDFDFLPDVIHVVESALQLYHDKKNQETETSYMVDNVIRKMILLADKYIDALGLEWARNNKMNDFTTTSKKSVRPDVLVYCRNVLVTMGEEKATNSTFADATADLDSYFKFWNTLAFGDLPLVIAFAAVGSRIQFYYYHAVESTTTPPKRESIGDVLSLGTEVKRNNFLAIRYIINIIRIIRTFDHWGVVKTPLLKLFKEIRRANGNTITIYPEEVRKSIDLKNIADEALHISLYKDILPGHYENVDYRISRYTVRLSYGPVGYLSIPKTEDELRHAIVSILQIVSELHSKEIVHRDIRWENVVRLKDGGWLLIDFEEAARIGDVRDTLMIAAPEYRNGTDTCQESGDIWMIGKLMDGVRYTLSERAQNFRNRLMIDDSNLRPTAIDALNDDWFNDDLME